MGELVLTMAQNGFAVGVAAWLLIRTEDRLEQLTLAIRELQAAIAGAVAKMEESHGRAAQR